MNQYVAVAFLGVNEGRTDEAHVECADLDDALARIRELVDTQGREWHAITLIHIEDYAPMLEDAEREPGPTP